MGRRAIRRRHCSFAYWDNRGRRLTAELLEARRLMHADYLCGEHGPDPLDHADEHPLHAVMDVARLHDRIQRHYIDGRPHDFTWDPAPPAGASDPVLTPATMSATLSPLTNIPALDSNPGATASIYLDFDGHFEATWGAYSNLTTPVYDVDGDAATYNEIELSNIRAVWERVAEDFRLFNINVTTVEPSVLAPGASSSAANGVAMRIAVGPQDPDGTGPQGFGGYAYINSFTSTISNVAYVFATATSGIRWMGDTSSHEAGHAFGLQHQSTYDENGVKVDEYNGGTPGWSPIMGRSVADLSTWHNGTSTLGPTSLQDDMSLIARSTNGFGYRADDHGSSMASATPLAGGGTTWSQSGFVGAQGDLDWFSLDLAQPENLRISVDGPGSMGNLDAVLELRDAAGQLIGLSNPGESFDAELTRNLVGRNYVIVQSNGQYGRLGQYTVSVAESLPGVSVTMSPAPYTTSESGRSESVTMVLDSRPTADVTFYIASTDPGEGVPSTSAVVFTPENWFTPQTFTIAGLDDGVVDGSAAYVISISAASSADLAYDGLFDPADIGVVNLDNTPGHVYWIRSDLTDRLAVVERSTLAGDAVQTVLNIPDALGPAPAGYHNPNRLSIDAVGGKMYWTDFTNKTINRANLDGSGAQIVLTLANTANDVAIDPTGGKIYWTDGVLDKIQRANLDGSGVEDVIAVGLTNPSGLELDLISSKLYWSDNTTYAISRANLDGSNIEVVRSGDGVNLPQNITLDVQSGKMYYGLRQNFDTQQLYRSNLDGSSEEMLVDLDAIDSSPNNPVVQGIAIDHAGGRILWSESLRQRVYSADLDGGNVAVVFEAGMNGLRGMAFLPAVPGFTVTPTSGLSTTEAGGTAAFSVVLNAPPTADVVIPLSSSDATEGAVLTSSLTFTTANWDIPQTVIVSGVDDAVYDQDVGYSIVLGPATSGDARYRGLNGADVSVVNRDNDPPPTKFYVVNDASQNRTYEYNPSGGLVESYNLNSGNAAPRGAASTIAGDKTWVVDANRKMFVYNTSGGLLGSWTAGTLASNATPEGIATNGADVWIVDSRSDRVFRYSAAAGRMSGSQTAASSFALNSGNSSPKDIVTDGQHLWVVNDASTDRVFKYTTAGVFLGSWTLDTANRAPTGLTIDPANPSHIWVVDSGTDRVYQYNAAVGRTSGGQSAAAWFSLAAGNTNPQGIADPPPHSDSGSLPMAWKTAEPGPSALMRITGGVYPLDADVDGHAIFPRRRTFGARYAVNDGGWSDKAFSVWADVRAMTTNVRAATERSALSLEAKVEETAAEHEAGIDMAVSGWPSGRNCFLFGGDDEL